MLGALQNPDFIVLWDQGMGEHPLDRAIGLISTIEGTERSDVASWSIDARDRALFRICARLFGPRIQVLAVCQACGAESEIDIAVADVLALEPAAERVTLMHGERRVACRVPDSRDLAAALASAAPRQALLSRLVEVGDPDDALLAVAEQALAKQAGLANLSLANNCHQCGAVSDHPFDILDYLWRRITAEAHRLLRDVHVLARAYGWTSSEILSLSPRRRAAHIALVGA